MSLFETERAAGRALVLAIVVGTSGSTYRKAGAWMTLAAGGAREGLLSGGCLEADLSERSQRMLSGDTRLELASYDSRSSDDPIWGLGLGCEGLMRIALLRVDAGSSWEPLATLHRLQQQRAGGAFALALEAAAPGLQPGDCAVFDPDGFAAATPTTPVAEAARDCWRAQSVDVAAGVFAFRWDAAPRVLICGAGPDVEPVVELGARQGWAITVVDHRSGYLEQIASRFPGAVARAQADPEKLQLVVSLDTYAAALVISHHLEADGQYLAALAVSRVPYVGLLGPAARRARLLAELGAVRAQALRPRLRAPVGLDLGGGTPESIALSIVAEIQSFLHARSGAPLSQTVAP